MRIVEYDSSKEKNSFALAATCSIIFVLLLMLSIVGIFYLIVFGLFFFITHGLLVGRLRGNSIRVTNNQFPELCEMVEKSCKDMGIEQIPEIYLLQEGGVLNAFATRFLGRDFVAVYSSVLEMAYEEGVDAVKFVVAHEVAHVALGHTKKQIWVAPAMFIPFVGTAYKRACEYSADAVGASVAPEGAVRGLCVLAAGSRLSHKVDVNSFVGQTASVYGFWEWLAEHLTSHPNLPKRISAIKSHT